MADSQQMRIEVRSVTPDEGRDGPQWKLSVKWPFSNYPIACWIDAGDEDMPAKGLYDATVTKGGLKEKQDGTSDDGTKDFHFKWYVNSLGESVDGKAPTTVDHSASTPVGSAERAPYSVDVDSRLTVEAFVQVGMNRRTALMQATGGVPYKADEVDDVLATADRYYQWLSEPPAGAPSSLVDAGDTGSAIQTPKGADTAAMDAGFSDAMKAQGIDRKFAEAVLESPFLGWLSKEADRTVPQAVALVTEAWEKREVHDA